MTLLKSSVRVSNLQIMRALLAKDWRFFRLPFIAIGILTIGCYIVAAAVVLADQPGHQSRSIAEKTLQAIFEGAIYGMYSTCVLAAVFGGMAIAGERAERTADFLGVLPITRKQIIVSKWLISILAVVGFAAFSLFISMSSATYIRLWQPNFEWEPLIDIWLVLATSLFGVGWLLSTFTRSATISSCLSITATTVVSAYILIAANMTVYERDQHMVTLGITLETLGVASVIVGTIYYLRRISP